VKNSRRLLPLLVSLAVIIPLAGLCFEHPSVNDFRSFYAGGSALISGRLADLYRQQRATASLPLEMPFIRPPVYAFVHAPLAVLPFAVAFCLWVGLQSALFLLFLYRAQSVHRVAAVACLFPPALIGIGSGQDPVMFLGVLVASYLLFRRQKEFQGGLALGLGLLKFHLFLIWPVVLLTQKRWRALAGFSIVAAAIAASSIALVGIDGVRDYLAVLADPKLTSPRVLEEVGIGGLMANMMIFSLTVQLALGLAVAAVAVYTVRRSLSKWTFVIIPAASLAITPHAIYYDPTLLLLPFWIVVDSTPHSRILRWISIALAGPWVFIAFLFPTPWSAISSIGVLTFLSAAIWTAAREQTRGYGV
jgi:hypothetical protein